MASSLASPERAPDTTETQDHRPPARGRYLTPTIREQLQVYVPLLAIIIGLSIYTNSRNGHFLSSGNVEQILTANAVLGILATGQTLLLVGGQFDLSVGSMVSFGSVLVAQQITTGTSQWLAIGMVVGVAVATGLLWGILVSRLKVAPFILTLGGLAVFASAATTIANSATVPLPNGLIWIQSGTWLGIPTPIVLWALVAIAGGIVLHFTRLGKTIYAVGANEEAAFLSGVSVPRVKISAFMLNGLFTGLAAIVMAGHSGAGDPNSGTGLELTTIAAIVLGGASLAGGRGTIIGSVLGVLVLGVVTSSLTFLNVPNSYNQFVFGAILIVAVTITATAELRRKRMKSKHR